MKNIFKLIISILVCQMAGGIGSIFTTTSIDSWYSTIIKPSFNPPNWVFGPVWTLLFIMMGIALYLVWKSNKNIKDKAILLFSIQLILNILWSVFFFGLKNPFLAFIEIIILWFFIAFTTISFSKISRTAAYLLVPYLMWVLFAAVLNFSIWRLNI